VPLTVDVTDAADRTVVHLSGEADLSGCSALAAALHEVTGSTGPVDVDLAEVRFFDSSCLGLLRGFGAELTAAGRTFRLVAVPPRTRRVLEIAGNADLLPTA
jgi:anti-anti-sigma factor